MAINLKKGQGITLAKSDYDLSKVTIGLNYVQPRSLIMDHTSPQDRRLDRRIPIDCPANIRSREGGEVSADCIELSVGGMTLHAHYAPVEGEVLEVMIPSPDDKIAHLVTHLRVTRCRALPDGRHEMGGTTVRVVT